jgi:uncharacterized lipoprotein
MKCTRITLSLIAVGLLAACSIIPHHRRPDRRRR